SWASMPAGAPQKKRSDTSSAATCRVTRLITVPRPAIAMSRPKHAVSGLARAITARPRCPPGLTAGHQRRVYGVRPGVSDTPGSDVTETPASPVADCGKSPLLMYSRAMMVEIHKHSWLAVYTHVEAPSSCLLRSEHCRQTIRDGPLEEIPQ